MSRIDSSDLPFLLTALHRELAATHGADNAARVQALIDKLKPVAQPVEAGERRRPVCDRCGGTDVSSDGAVRWDEATGDWVLSSVFDDDGHCDDCASECRIRWVQVPATPAKA